MTSRHTFTLAVLAAVSCLNVAALAQTYPSRAITMIVPIAPGGVIDAVARIIADGLFAGPLDLYTRPGSLARVLGHLDRLASRDSKPQP